MKDCNNVGGPISILEFKDKYGGHVPNFLNSCGMIGFETEIPFVRLHDVEESRGGEMAQNPNAPEESPHFYSL